MSLWPPVTPKPSERLADELDGGGRRALAITADVSDPASVAAMVKSPSSTSSVGWTSYATTPPAEAILRRRSPTLPSTPSTQGWR